MEKAIQASPSDPEPYHYLGRYYESNLNNFPRALSYFLQSLVHDPRNLRSLYFKGYCLQMLDRHEEAASSYEAAIQFVEANNDTYGWPYQKLAELLWERDLDAALRSAKRAVELVRLEPGCQLVFLRRVNVHFLRKERLSENLMRARRIGIQRHHRLKLLESKLTVATRDQIGEFRF